MTAVLYNPVGNWSPRIGTPGAVGAWAPTPPPRSGGRQNRRRPSTGISSHYTGSLPEVAAVIHEAPAAAVKPRWMNRAAAAVLLTFVLGMAVLPIWPLVAAAMTLIGFVGITLVGGKSAEWRARHPLPSA